MIKTHTSDVLISHEDDERIKPGSLVSHAYDRLSCGTVIEVTSERVPKIRVMWNRPPGEFASVGAALHHGINHRNVHMAVQKNLQRLFNNRDRTVDDIVNVDHDIKSTLDHLVSQQVLQPGYMLDVRFENSINSPNLVVNIEIMYRQHTNLDLNQYVNGFQQTEQEQRLNLRFEL